MPNHAVNTSQIVVYS